MSANRIRFMMSNVCQTCHIPPRCTLGASITFGSIQDTYRQEPSFSRHYYYLVDPDKKPYTRIPLELTATPKHCISNSKTCPTGNVFTEDRALFAEFNPASPFTGSLLYTNKISGFSLEEHNPVVILERLITRDNTETDPRYRQHYTMRLSECDGKPFLSLPRAMQIGAAAILPVTHGLPVLFAEGARALADARFHLILNRELIAKVSIGLESEINEKSTKDRKIEQIRNNAKAGKRPTANGWTKRTDKYQIKKSLTIEGDILSVIGSDRIGHNKELKQVFTKDKNKLSLLDYMDTGFNTINKALRKGKDEGLFPLVSAEFLYPKLEIEGSIKTDMSAENRVINRGEVIVGFAPFFGFKITLDLLTALTRFLGPYGHVVNTARTVAATKEEAVKAGEDGAYVILKLELTFSFGIHGFYEFKTDDNGRFSSADREVEIHGEITGDAHIEAGVNIFGVSGFFRVGAEFKTTLKMGFDRDEGDDLTAVVYHEGVKAKVYVKVSKSGSSPSKKGGGDEDSATDGKYEEWVIYEELPKDKSDWKFKLG